MWGYLPPSTPTFPYKPPLTKRTIKKYNYDGTKGPLIYLFRNGAYHESGHPFAVNPRSTPSMAHLYSQITRILRPFTGPVRRIHSIDGHQVTSIYEFKDRFAYIICSGEGFDFNRIPFNAVRRNQQQMTADSTPLAFSTDPPRPVDETIEVHHVPSLERVPSEVPRKVFETVHRLRESSPQTPRVSSSDFVINVFENGCCTHNGVAVPITLPSVSERPSTVELFTEILHRCRDALDKKMEEEKDSKWNFQEVSDTRLFDGNVTGLFTVNGSPVRSIHSLRNHENYVAVRNFDPFDLVQLPIKLTSRFSSTSPSTSSQRYVHGSHQQDDPIKMGNEVNEAESNETVTIPSSVVTIYVFRNGHLHDSPLPVVLNRERIRTHDQLRAFLTESVGGYINTGTVRNVYDQEGKKVTKWSGFRHGGQYVLTGAEGLDFVRLPHQFKVIKGSQLHKTIVDSSVSHMPSLSSSPTPTPLVSAPPPCITIFKDGELHDRGMQVVLLRTKFRTIDHLFGYLSSKLRLPTGPVTCIFDLNGRKIKKIDNFDHNGWYLASSGFLNTKRLPYRISELLRKLEKRNEFNTLNLSAQKVKKHRAKVS
ncbi:hypothetical protein P9112_011395 [Eukaryota sp. TZLM1-RC]